MKNLRVATKLVVVFVVIMGLVICSNFVNARQLERLDEEVNFMYDAAFQLANSADGMYVDVEASLKFMYNALAVDDPDVVAVASASLKTSLEESETHLEKLRAVDDYIQSVRGGGPQAAKIAAAMQSLEDSYEAFLPYQNQVLAYVDAMDREAGLMYLENTAIPYANALIADLEYLVELADESAALSLSEYGVVKRTTRLAINAVGVAIGVVLLILGFVIVRNINGPIKELQAATAKLAAGELDTKIAYTSKDELGQLADSLRYMIGVQRTLIEDIAHVLGSMADGDLTVTSDTEYPADFKAVKDAVNRILETLNDAIGSIHEAAEQVSSGAGEVSSSAQSLAGGATEQAASVEQLSSVIAEVKEQAKSNHEAALRTLEAVDQATDLTRASVASMEAMNEAMAHIDASSQNIAKINKVIEDIAFQTNILSLNAAVEAARAGAAGKGFAVVADEVRTLAAKSAEAAKETTEFIESSLESVAQGNRMAKETSESLQRVSEVAEGIVDYMHALGDASERQARSIDEVTIGIDQISAVVQANSATAEQSAAASEEMSSQATLMSGLVSQFRTRRRGAVIYDPVIYAEPEAVHYDEVDSAYYPGTSKYDDLKPAN